MTGAPVTLVARIAPPSILGGAGRMFERNLLVYRRAWMIVFSGFFDFRNPLRFRLSILFAQEPTSNLPVRAKDIERRIREILVVIV